MKIICFESPRNKRLIVSKTVSKGDMRKFESFCKYSHRRNSNKVLKPITHRKSRNKCGILICLLHLSGDKQNQFQR